MIRLATYTYDQSWVGEQKRLSGIEELWDSATMATLDHVGLGQGWRCLEIGAGNGSIARWLADRVGKSGEVIATDIDPSLIDGADRANLRVLRHDISSDVPLPGPFHVVHARLVLSHLPNRVEILHNLAQLCAFGGILVIEEFDWPNRLSATDSAGSGMSDAAGLYFKANQVVNDFMVENGYDPEYGARLPHDLRSCGLVDIDAVGNSRLIRGATTSVEFDRQAFLQLADRLTESGLLTRPDITQVLACLDDPNFLVLSPVLVTAWGRRPHAGH